LALYLAAEPRGQLRQRLRENAARIAAFMALANLPDVDLLVGAVVYGDALHIHGAITHGLPFAAVAALVLALLWPLEGRRRRSFLLYFAVIGSHGVIDLFTSHLGLGLVRTSGVAILSPFVREKISPPFALFYGPLHGSWAKLLSLHNVVSVLLESVGFSALIGFIVLVKERRGDR
jgi:membrane-bound metal-dependent hydrolase YbcI (DUF457 family)